MARTVQQQLDAVDSAIQAIEEGSQSYTTPLGQTFTKANLATLYAMRTELEGKVALADLPGDGPAGVMELGLGRIS